MVSKASDDFPEPEIPVKTMSRSRGSRSVTSLRLCSRAPWIVRSLLVGSAATASAYRPGRTVERMFGRGAAPALPDRAQLAAQLGDLVAQARRLLEAQVLRGVVHLVLE